MAFTKLIMEINKKVNGKFSKLGEHVIFVPTLKDIAPFVMSDIKKDDKGVEVYEDGLPIYESDQANWLQSSILAYVKADARNKMEPGTANLREGKKIAETWEELTAEALRDGSGLALAREFKAAFAEWVKKQNLNEAAANALTTLVSNRAALTLQQPSTKEKVRARLEAFANDSEEEVVTKFERPLEAALQACEVKEDAATSMDF